MHDVSVQALPACEEALKPGLPMGKPFEIYARFAEENNITLHRFNVCGQLLGTAFASTWMNWFMIFHDN